MGRGLDKLRSNKTQALSRLAQSQCLRRLTSPVFTPLGAIPVFTPLGWSSSYAAWLVQYLCRLAGPVFMPLDELSIYAAWRLFVVYEGEMGQNIA